MTQTTPPSTADTANPSPTRVILVGLIGNVMEWYDFAVYGYFATVIGQLFFPAEEPVVSLIASFGAFAAGFLVRPLGGLLFGRIGDVAGRKRAMTLSVMAMAVPTVLMGCLPTYATIGIAAPILVTLLRIVQGLSVGGEFTNSLVFLVENAPTNRRSFAAVWSTWGASAGILLGSGVGWLVASNLDQAQLAAWGWRIPFLLGGLVAVTGWWMRRNLAADVPGMQAGNPVREVFTRYRRPVLRVALLNVGAGVSFYTAFVYAVTYIRNIDHLSNRLALEANTLAILVLLAVLPLVALLSDRAGERRVMAVASVLLVAAVIPAFELMDSGNTLAILGGQLSFALVVALLNGSLQVMNVDLMPAPIRCTGLAFAYNTAMGLFGGPTPMIETWLIHATGSPIAPAYWVMVTAVVSLLALVWSLGDNDDGRENAES